jgi:exosortase
MLAVFNLAALFLGAVGLGVLLLPLWRSDPNLSHGLVVPFLLVVLVLESRFGGRPHFLRRSPAVRVLGAGFLGLGAFYVTVAGLYGSALGPSNAMACFFASGGLALILLAAWMPLADENVRIVSFGWPAVVAVALLPLSSPLPPGLYLRLSLALQGWVTRAVAGTLGLLGIAAYRDGNVIELAHSNVGVSEACSGVRSLVSCFVAGLVLSAILVQGFRARAILVVMAPALALVMNFVRSLVLTLVANADGKIGSGWHNGAGFVVIGATTVILGLTAIALGGRRNRDGPPAPSQVPLLKPRHQAALALTLCLLAVLLAIMAAARRPGGSPMARAPGLEALFPAAPAGWQVRADQDLAQFTPVLSTPSLARKTYSTTDAQGPFFVTLYVAYWLPHQASASLVSLHTPDFCWPGTDWVAEPLASPRVSLSIGGRALPRAECRRFSKGGRSTRVWFWHLFAGKPLIHANPYTVGGILKLALAYDLRRNGDQLFVVVSSNRDWDEVSSSPSVRDFFGRTAPLGL